MKLERALDEVFGIESGQLAKGVVLAGQHERAIEAGPHYRCGRSQIHYLWNKSELINPADRGLPLPKRFMPEAEHLVVMLELGLALQAPANPRIADRLMNQEQLARIVEVFNVRARHRAKLGQRIELRRLNSGIAGRQPLDTIGGELEEKVIAGMEVEVDGTDGDLGLLRDHFDSGALEAMLREY